MLYLIIGGVGVLGVGGIILGLLYKNKKPTEQETTK